MSNPIDQDVVPATMAEAVDAFYASLDDADKRYILETPGFIAKTHHTLGRSLRNIWSLWEDTPMRRDFIKITGLWGHGDDISSILTHQVVARVRGQSEDITTKVAEFKAHWVKQGIDPETGSPLSNPTSLF